MSGRGGSIRVTNNVVYFTSKFLRQGNSALAKNFVETITKVLQCTKVQFCSQAKNLWLQLKHFYQNSIFINTLIINTCLVVRCVWFHPITIIGYKWFYKHCHIAHGCPLFFLTWKIPHLVLSLLTMIHYHNGNFPITFFIFVTSKPGKQCFSMENFKHTIRHLHCRNLPHDIFLVVFDLLWFGLWHHCKWVVDCNISMLYFWPRSWK